MRKNIKRSLIFVFVLIIVCTVVVVLNPMQLKHDSTASSGSSETVSDDGSSAAADEMAADMSTAGSLTSEESSVLESSVLESSTAVKDDTSAQASQVDSELISGLVPEDQPDTPDLNYETSGSSYDDIMVNVLTCLLSRDTASLAEYVGASGLCLSPTGTAVASDVILSSAQVAAFFDQGTQTYGTYPGSGEKIRLSAEEYYNSYIVPSSFDFSTAVVSYNDAADIAAASAMFSNPKTVSYEYTPNVMEWQRLIMVYCSEGTGDVLCGIIYQDVTTN